ncbi:hypothetical protein MICAF_5120001 [Microcystis aeruginosa PCC 9807]|uniref:Uncharacterized protein n=1 Tax=Microcystis aeruginosa PCC 9807 TaxID=1160283 RepID=I4HBS4_MICAE|nr:hypothetical protein MICAF_5120001 [Microcystis aeruginosa PCC 9807]
MNLTIRRNAPIYLSIYLSLIYLVRYAIKWRTLLLLNLVIKN